jgi:hypothetical protein
VKGGVEAGDGGKSRPQAAQGADGRHGGRVVEGGQVGERLQPAGDVVVDQHALAELGSAVYDPVAGGVRLRHAIEKAGKGGPRVVGRRKVLCREYIGAVEQSQLEAARPGVDDQDAHDRVPA